MAPIWETSPQSPGEPISGVRTLEGSWHPAQLSSITHDRGHPTFNFVCQCLVRSSSSPSFHVARSFPLPLFPYVATSSGGSTTKYIFYSCETYGSRPQSHIRNYHRKILHFSMPRFEPGSCIRALIPLDAYCFRYKIPLYLSASVYAPSSSWFDNGDEYHWLSQPNNMFASNACRILRQNVLVLLIEHK